MIDIGQWLGIAVTLLQVCSPHSYLIIFIVRLALSVTVIILRRLVGKTVHVRVRIHRHLTRGQYQYILILTIAFFGYLLEIKAKLS